MTITKIAARVTLGLILSAVLLARADQPSASIAEFMKNPDGAAIVRGDYFKAMILAYKDFSKTIAEHKQEDRLSKIENYDFYVEQSPSTFIVQIGPTMRDPSHTTFGGGARYFIDRRNFSITEKVPLK